jgi:hypothetical protein
MNRFTVFFFLFCLFGQLHAQLGASTRSVLADGQLFKITVEKRGIHRINVEQLSKLGVNVSTLNPNAVQLFGSQTGMLPEVAGENTFDDLQEIPFSWIGGANGQLNASDYLVFFAEGADKFHYDPTDKQFAVKKNAFDSYNYYFLKISTTKKATLVEQPSINAKEYVTETFDDCIHYEEDKVNLLDAFISTQGSGRRWYGDQFRNVNTYKYNFTFPDLVTTAPVRLKAAIAARSKTSRRFSIEANGTKLESNLITETSRSFTDPAESTFANIGSLLGTFNTDKDNIELSISYNGDEGWVDYITLNARRRLLMNEEQLMFRDLNSLNFPTTTYKLENAKSNIQIWDITDPLNPQRQLFTQSGNTITFGTSSQKLKEFVAFYPIKAISPISIQPIGNQNLHGIQAVNMVILYHANFAVPAQRLADHREDYSNLKVQLINIDEVFNEFSSGRQDPSAIRDFARMLYRRDTSFQYLLLFGDGSFDYRNIGKRGGNFITVYQTERSENPITAFPSDDYYALLDDGEGVNLQGDLDIAVGRLPVKNLQEARLLVDKIINYDLSANAFGEWRNRLVFVADDGDNNLHLRDADRVASKVANDYAQFNQEKIYFDAFPRTSTSGGAGFPLATEALNQAIFQGALAVNYLGHGGAQGWAQERVLDKNRGDIRNWTNFNRLPVFITATCSFAGYDDPNQVTGGEEVILNPNGGGIALFTTVRAVYASSNAALVRSVFDVMLEKIDGKRPTLGQIMQRAKNSSSVGRSENSRKFTLLGDPAQPLALPVYNVATTRINGKDARITMDTLRALQIVEIEGEIQDENGRIIENFNGELTPTVFDKPIIYSTLGQDTRSQPFDFFLQKNTIFKGKASVQQGRFKFQFVVPKDINFQLGQGKISYYAQDTRTMLDASGHYNKVIIGGASDNLLADNKGPEIKLFMDNENFKPGDQTSANPLLIVKLYDESGINVVGNSIGHDLEAILDGNTQNTFLLNEFYKSELDNYQRGEVRFPLSNLSPGRHSIRVSAWDVANNFSEASTEFVVIDQTQAKISNVMAFPNPLSEGTCFAFQHNVNNQALEVKITIYTVDGKLIKTIQERILAQGNAVDVNNCIAWDGITDSGKNLEKGIYIYTINAETSRGEPLSSSSGKLVVIR